MRTLNCILPIQSIVLILLTFQAFGQKCYKESTKENLKSDYKSVWQGMTFQGTVGNDNQRIEIRFISVSREKKSAGTYKVAGKSKINTTTREFKGSVKVKKVMTLIKSNADCRIPDNPDMIISGTYELKQNRKQKKTGIFKGEFKTMITRTANGFKSHNGQYSDEGTNVFMGLWREYNKKDSKYCSWGRQIPPSKNNNLFKHYENREYLFNVKYIDKGWKSYVVSNLKTWISLPVDFNGDRPKFEVDFIDTYTEEEINKCKQIEKREWWK